MIWALLALSLIEIGVVHLLIALWIPWLGLLLAGLSLCGIGWLVALLRSLPRCPVLVGEGRVVMRVGRLWTIEVPASAIAGLRSEWSAEALKAPDVARLSLLAYPNVVLDLAEPLPGRRGRPIRAIAHRLDDPAAFSAAIAALRRGDAG